MDNYYFSAKAFAVLQERLPNAGFHDATYLANWQRAVKSPQELDYMEKAARIVERMHARLFELIEPGLRQNALVAESLQIGRAAMGARVCRSGEISVVAVSLKKNRIKDVKM